MGLGKELAKKVNLDIFFDRFSRFIDVPGCISRRGFLGLPLCKDPRLSLSLVQPMLQQVLSLSSYDIVHVQTSTQGVSAYIVDKIFGVPYIFSIHAPPRFDVPSLKLADEICHLSTPILAKKASSCVTVSNYMKRLLRGWYDLNPHVIYHGVDFGSFNPSVNGAPILKKHSIRKKVILSVMRLVPHKDPLTLLKAAILVSRKKDVIFVIIGTGVLERQVKHFVRENNMTQHIMLLPHVDDINQYFAACDVFALSSIGEPFGMVVVEAMACGKAVVVSSSGALPEVVGDAGLLFEPRNPRELAEKIIWLLSNQSAMEELGLKGYDRVASMFRWDVAARKYFELYKHAF